MTETDLQSGYIGGDNTNLIINYLPQMLTDDDFRKMFLSAGPIKSCRIIRDKMSNYSFGFGFVDYFTEEDAKCAIQTLNGYHMNGKTIKVALARPSGEEIKGANLYIRNLPINWTKEELDMCFSHHGEIIQSRVLMDHVKHESCRAGFVLFSKKSEAESAIAHFNGKVPPGAVEAIYIKFADKKGKKDAGVNLNMQNFFMNPSAFMGFNPQMNFAGMRNAGPNNFNDFGATDNSGRYPPPGPMRNQNRLRYNPVASTQGPNAANTTNVTVVNQDSQGFVLYVYNIGEYNEKNLWDMFTPFGGVMKVAVVYDLAKGVSKGYAFVTMSNYTEAQNAIYHLNGCDLLCSGRALQVSFKVQKNTS